MAKATSKKAPAKKKAAAKKAPAKTQAPAKKAAPKKKPVLPQKYTANAMVAYLADFNDLPKAKMKEVFEGVFDVVQSGVLAGQRVPIGKLGKVYVRVRPAQKARKGRDPLTGQEITIPAKKATKVPKFSFNKVFKEVAAKAKATK